MKEEEVMKFCSTYLWEKGKEEVENPVSLILQQVLVRRQAVLFGCVCLSGSAEVSGRFTEALVEWFHRECLELLERKWSQEELERSMRKEVTEVLKEVMHYGETDNSALPEFAGILLVEQWFCMFSAGQIQVFLVNRRYNRKHMRCIAGNAAWEKTGESDMDVYAEALNDMQKKVQWQSGEVQRRLGLLLCTEGFLRERTMDEVAEVLLADGEPGEERLQKRLRELWEVRQDKAKSAGAVYIRTC